MGEIQTIRINNIPIRKKLSILLLLYLSILISTENTRAQSPDFPRDTSFSVWSATQKVKKKYPFVSAVKEYEKLPILSERDVIYIKHGFRALHMDVFYPEKKSKSLRPAILCIHGGGWASGNKSHLVPLAQKLAGEGYVAVSVEYRLSPEAKYPAGVKDVKTAVRYLKASAGIYGIDTTKIAVLGTSAGATLASLVGTTGGNPLFMPETREFGYTDEVQAIINIDGVVDFTDPAESGKDEDPSKPSAGARWFGSTYKEKPEIWNEASALSYVGPETPPTIFINSSLPRYHAGRDEFIAVLEKEGIYHCVYTLEETPHPFWLFHPWFDQLFPFIQDFLEEIF